MKSLFIYLCFSPFLWPFFWPLQPIMAQKPGHIQGRIVDADTKQPLIGAHVLVMGSETGGATDMEGLYRIENLDEDVYKLRVSYIGYADFVETDVRVIRGKTTYVNEIQLASSPLLGEAVTVTPEITTVEVSSHAYQREEIRRSPGTAGDVLRALGSLPGVSTSEGEFSAMSVRGSGVYDNLILVDNIPFEKINHFEGGNNQQETQGGRFGVFTGGLIERVTFYGGGFGAEYGRKGASVVDMQIKEGNTESPTINGSYDLLGPELNYDGPTYLLNNTSLVLNVRDFDMKRALEIAGEEEFGDPTMTDIIAKTTTRLNAHHKLNLLGIYSADRMIRSPRNIMAGDDLVENDLWDIEEARWLSGVNWRWLTSDESVLQNTAFVRGNKRDRAIGYAWADGFDGALPPDIAQLGFREGIGTQHEEELEIGWKSDFYTAIGSASTIQAGMELYRVDLDYSSTLNSVDTLYQFTSLDIANQSDQKYLVIQPEDVNYAFNDATTHLGLYTSIETSIGRWQVTPGIRYTYNGFGDHHRVSPRVQVRYQVAKNTMLNLATGIYYQRPVNKIIVAHPDNKGLEDERSIHVIAGVSHLLQNDLRFTLEGYYKHMDNLITSPLSTSLARTNAGDGWASGFDAILLKQFTGNYYGQISYSFAASKRNDHDGFGTYNAPFNQPHNFAAILGYQVNKEWFVSWRWKYAVGRPKDRFIVHPDVLDNPDRLRFSQEIIARNADRLADFHLMSIRVDYRKQFGPLALVTFIEIDNIYDHYNAYEDRFSELTGEEKGLGFGLAGNAGFKLEF